TAARATCASPTPRPGSPAASRPSTRGCRPLRSSAGGRTRTPGAGPQPESWRTRSTAPRRRTARPVPGRRRTAMGPGRMESPRGSWSGLRPDGIFDHDDLANRRLPAPERLGPIAIRELEVRQLLAQRAGLVDHAGRVGEPALEDPDRRRVEQRVRDLQVLAVALLDGRKQDVVDGREPLRRRPDGRDLAQKLDVVVDGLEAVLEGHPQ